MIPSSSNPSLFAAMPSAASQFQATSGVGFLPVTPPTVLRQPLQHVTVTPPALQVTATLPVGQVSHSTASSSSRRPPICPTINKGSGSADNNENNENGRNAVHRRTTTPVHKSTSQFPPTPSVRHEEDSASPKASVSIESSPVRVESSPGPVRSSSVPPRLFYPQFIPPLAAGQQYPLQMMVPNVMQMQMPNVGGFGGFGGFVQQQQQPVAHSPLVGRQTHQWPYHLNVSQIPPYSTLGPPPAPSHGMGIPSRHHCTNANPSCPPLVRRRRYETPPPPPPPPPRHIIMPVSHYPVKRGVKMEDGVRLIRPLVYGRDAAVQCQLLVDREGLGQKKLGQQKQGQHLQQGMKKLTSLSTEPSLPEEGGGGGGGESTAFAIRNRRKKDGVDGINRTPPPPYHMHHHSINNNLLFFPRAVTPSPPLYKQQQQQQQQQPIRFDTPLALPKSRQMQWTPELGQKIPQPKHYPPPSPPLPTAKEIDGGAEMDVNVNVLEPPDPLLTDSYVKGGVGVRKGLKRVDAKREREHKGLGVLGKAKSGVGVMRKGKAAAAAAAAAGAAVLAIRDQPTAESVKERQPPKETQAQQEESEASQAPIPLAVTLPPPLPPPLPVDIMPSTTVLEQTRGLVNEIENITRPKTPTPISDRPSLSLHSATLRQSKSSVSVVKVPPFATPIHHIRHQTPDAKSEAEVSDSCMLVSNNRKREPITIPRLSLPVKEPPRGSKKSTTPTVSLTMSMPTNTNGRPKQPRMDKDRVVRPPPPASKLKAPSVKAHISPSSLAAGQQRVKAAGGGGGGGVRGPAKGSAISLGTLKVLSQRCCLCKVPAGVAVRHLGVAAGAEGEIKSSVGPADFITMTKDLLNTLGVAVPSDEDLLSVFKIVHAAAVGECDHPSHAPQPQPHLSSTKSLSPLEASCVIALLCGGPSETKMRAIYDLLDSSAEGLTDQQLSQFLRIVFRMLLSPDKLRIVCLRRQLPIQTADELAGLVAKEAFGEIDPNRQGTRMSFESFQTWCNMPDADDHSSTTTSNSNSSSQAASPPPPPSRPTPQAAAAAAAPAVSVCPGAAGETLDAFIEKKSLGEAQPLLGSGGGGGAGGG
ncbi:unnamed protein product [Vitrella brassicaformis CCMP3155]|uniref:EF-hand domain-containing protein n=2 Tax=Vitrella brassicaformis TaxID=1169539 RepID=A0A0G4FQX5_VITBC|nr:unnamed protein product [Vitrella brassicaformis CCMP3155]|eukprot:CEM16859.1 unnamed protein product [Vitrella brassicaformis CCMP3155]